ncbi:MAG: VTT domain-containing protein [Thermoproteota archaeon]
MEQLAYQYGYIGIFLVCFIGSLSVVFPIPYTLIIYLLGSVLDPFFVAVSGGLGSALGEVIGYLLGYYGRAVISEKQRRNMDFMLKVFSKYGAMAIFLFALTPLPDDLLIIPLGIMHYNLLKFLIPCILGKSLMCFILSLGGRLSIVFIKEAFGGDGGWLMTFFTLALLIAIIAFMLKFDWEKFFVEHFEKREGHTQG